ncbi:MAG: caspase family protein [Candidatus Lokiarchaeota archaeon]
MLINDYNFKSENIIYLQDSSASKNAISNALDNIASKIDSNDIFFFYYSGHGGFGTEMGPYSVSIQTPHPYSNNYENTWSISYSGAQYMRVHFYRFSCEYGYDYLLCGDSDVYYDYCYEAYSGDYGYNFWSSYIPVDRYYLRFVSDYSETDYGFKVDKYEAILNDGTHYICSYDSIPDNPNNYYIDDLLDSKLDQFSAQEKYIILDSCNSGGFIPEVQQVGRYIMTACESDESSLEDPSLRHGVFTNYFLNSNEFATDSNGDDVISLEEMYTYTRENTISTSNELGYTHHPLQYDGISGQAVLTTAFSSVSFNLNNNSLSYSFDLYGTGLINKLNLITIGDFESHVSKVSDLTLNSSSETGFGSYSGNITLDNAITINSYGIIANISGNQDIILSEVISNDSDSDLLDDVYELNDGLDPFSNDTDTDGIMDGLELNYSCNPHNEDTDGDGILDGTEVYSFHTNPIQEDTDGDQLSDYDEIFIFNTSANNIDTENDGMDDFFEVNNFLDPLIDDSNLDPDNDMLSNLLEWQCSSNPNLNDTDYDSMDDYYEYLNNLDLNLDDTNLDHDGDGLTNLLEYLLGSLANNIDSDNDQMPDSYEYENNLNLTLDDSMADADSDNLQNIFEYILSTDPNDPDTDNDGLTDGSEKFTYHTNPLNPDSDGDGSNDGIEIIIGTNPLDPKSSLITYLLNIFGGVILGISGLYGVRRYRIYTKKAKNKNLKPYNFQLKLNTSEFETLRVEKINKPMPKKQISIPFYQSRGYRPPDSILNKYSIGFSDKMIQDFLKNKLPPPKPINSEMGIRAMFFLTKAFELRDQGRFYEFYDYLIKSLVMGVPEPFNSQIKSQLLGLFEARHGTLNYQPNEKNFDFVECNSCHQVTKRGKFCSKCGKPLIIEVNEENLKTKETSINFKICPICQTKMPNDYKFCTKCGRVL